MRSNLKLLAPMLMIFATPVMAIDLCPPEHASYRLNWTANMANERGGGQPSMAFAMSPDGPALPVELKFSGPQGAFPFNSPRVSGVGTGALTIDQSLSMHDEYTITELMFNRHVVNLNMTIEGLDEKRSFNGGYSDRLMMGGADKRRDYVIEPFISKNGSSRLENQARRDLRRRLGRETLYEVAPVPADTFTTSHWTTINATFEQPVSYVRMTLGSDPEIFSPGHFAQRPGSQSVKITDVSFCVPFGSRVGD